MISAISLMLALQIAPPPPDGDRWAFHRTVHTVSDTLTCEPNGTFSVNLNWRFRHGVDHATVSRHGKPLPNGELQKITSALQHATDLNFVRLSCLGKRDAEAMIAYVDPADGVSEKRLWITIRPDRIELSGPLKVATPEQTTSGR